MKSQTEKSDKGDNVSQHFKDANRDHPSLVLSLLLIIAVLPVIIFLFNRPIEAQSYAATITNTTTSNAIPIPTPISSGTMSAPPGYSHLIFDDTFSGSTLDSTRWIPQIADQNGIWNNNGALPYPLSAVGNAGGYNAEYGNPSQVTVGNGLTLSARRDKSQKGYTWEAGYITTHSKFTFNRGYAQFRVKMPDSTTGMWGGIWFLEGGGEIDLDETGYTALGNGKVNQVIAANLHTSGNSQKFYNSGVNLSAGYHIYGMEYLPGKSVKMYLDGKQIAQFTSNVPTGAYTVIVTMTVAQNASGWHTVVSSLTPSPMAMHVSEVQIWTAGTTTPTFTPIHTNGKKVPAFTPTTRKKNRLGKSDI